ncbi:MAG: hypothetical protein AB7F64_02350 [Gammaproteobacteria bacterium]
MLKKIYLFLSLAIITILPTYAADNQCFIQLNKDPKWSAYEVTITMFDLSTNNSIKSYVLKKATKNSPSVDNLEKPFDCMKHPIFSFRASFSPPIWQNLANKQYLAKKVWNLTSQLLENSGKQLIITVNFPDDFVEVPELINLSANRP